MDFQDSETAASCCPSGFKAPLSNHLTRSQKLLKDIGPRERDTQREISFVTCHRIATTHRKHRFSAPRRADGLSLVAYCQPSSVTHRPNSELADTRTRYWENR